MLMVSVSKRADQRTWQVRWRDDAGRQRSRQFSLKRDAEAHATEIRTRLESGTLTLTQREKATVGDAYASWVLAHPEWAASTRERNASVWKNHVAPRWSEVRLSKVTRAEVQRWIDELPGAQATRKKALSVLSGPLQLAVQDRWIARSPIADIRVGRREVPKRRRYLQWDQVQALEEAAAELGGSTWPQATAVIRTLAITGIRFGELAGLQRHDLDTRTRDLHIERSFTEVNGTLVESPPKNGNPRTIRVPRHVMDLLEPLCVDLNDQAHIFRSPKGQILRNRSVRRGWFDAAAAKIGVPDLTPHSLRHTAASIAISSGASALQVRNMLGHASASITLDTYSDLFDTDVGKAADAIDRAHAAYVHSRALQETRSQEERAAAEAAAAFVASSGDLSDHAF
ncbi:site-specific recombinase, phage integrase family [Dermacoccus sp. Ellin185]|nr:site-specific recombinase, phage integrase family [Dermacoccus sp. Ellin185]